MIITPVKTSKITIPSPDIFSVLQSFLPKLEDGSVVAVTSKIVSICEGSVVAFDATTKDELIKKQSEKWLPADQSKYGHHFTVLQNTIIASAGVDESNGDGYYILWPKDSQETANQIRTYLADAYRLKNIGVVITDSTSQPMRRGTTGIALAHSGFASIKNYIGQPDLFGRTLQHIQANIAGGLAAASVLAMGEGAEQTPIAVISDVPFVNFQDRDPSAEELVQSKIELEDDLFAPFLTAVDWQKGTHND